MVPAVRMAAAVAFAAALLAAEPQWRIQFFHDEDRSRFEICDLRFVSATRGVAVGMLSKEDGDTKPMSVVTSDGGARWDYVPLKEAPVSLFFLDERAGWMVTADGIWFTEEAGRSWRKVSKKDGLYRVHFLSLTNGFAVGPDKTFLRTSDGGKTWTQVPEGQAPESNKGHTTYSWITFATEKVGMAGGRSLRPEKEWDNLPDWIDPEAAEVERPAYSILFETRDAGQTWTHSTVSLFGRISKVRMERSGRALGLIEYDHLFKWPSEVMELALRTGKSRTVLARKDLAVTDIGLVPNGPAYAVGFEPPGRLARSPIPGRLRVLQSLDLENWAEMEVDYRASARRALLAIWDIQNIWVATDTGMILRRN
jgi:hypothetical protein